MQRKLPAVLREQDEERGDDRRDVADPPKRALDALHPLVACSGPIRASVVAFWNSICLVLSITFLLYFCWFLFLLEVLVGLLGWSRTGLQREKFHLV